MIDKSARTGDTRVENAYPSVHPEEDRTGPGAIGRETRNLADLIGDIYEAAENRTHWKTVLASLSQAAGGTCAALFVHDCARNSGYIAYSHRIPEYHRRNYRSQYAPANPWLLAYEKGLPFGRLVAGDAIFPNAKLQNSYFFRGFLRPLDVFYTLHAGLSKERQRETHLLLGRRKVDGTFGPGTIDTIQNVVPHLARAWKLGERQIRAEQLGRYALQALDRLAVGVVIVDADDKVLIMNREAQDLFENSAEMAISPDGQEVLINGRAWEPDRLQAEEEQEATRFYIMSARRASGRGPVAVLRWDSAGSPNRSNQFCKGSPIFISDPYRKGGRFDAAMIRHLFALTPAEARVASKMAHGNSLDGVAHELGISIHTARTHLKRIFEKTGVERQAELVHVLQNTFGFLRAASETNDTRQHD